MLGTKDVMLHCYNAMVMEKIWPIRLVFSRGFVLRVPFPW